MVARVKDVGTGQVQARFRRSLFGCLLGGITRVQEFSGVNALALK
jgi:hypothetical protein